MGASECNQTHRNRLLKVSESIKEIERIAEQARDALLEHADSVQIFCTLHDGVSDSTMSVEVGGGNAFARLGQIVEWLNAHESCEGFND